MRFFTCVMGFLFAIDDLDNFSLISRRGRTMKRGEMADK
jgi:hypothetical protein